ncbi:MAG: MATE family efflux transporter, partial [Proteobacteria bacterium]|nr:MATE family efflux transporter [Pseudomonadota bacterium]MBU1611404.1 MATE family efflux transporter [Pseudomonadota bacterium]
MTVPVMLVNMTGAAVNIPLDYVLINGWGWFPEMGIVGAGVATVTGSFVMVVLFGVLIFTRENNARFRVLSNWRLDRALFWRFMHFGLPGGVNFFVDMFAVTFFVFMVGRIGGIELAATNMVISLDLMIFLPVIGFGFATGVLVGQFIGAEDPNLGFKVSRSAMQICVAWMGLMALAFLCIPEMLMGLFKDRSMSVEQFATIVEMGKQMLRYVAVYAVLDGVVLIYFGALKGAGDIRFVMWSIVCCSIVCMVVPITLLVNYTDLGFHGPWICLTSYVAVLTVISWFRFRSGAWTRMRVIEKAGEKKPA